MDKIKFETFSDGLVGCLLDIMVRVPDLQQVGMPDYNTLKDQSDNSFPPGNNPMSLKLNLSEEHQRDYEKFRVNLAYLQEQHPQKEQLNMKDLTKIVKKLSGHEFDAYSRIYYQLDQYAQDEMIVATRGKASDF